LFIEVKVKINLEDVNIKVLTNDLKGFIVNYKLILVRGK